MTITHHGCAGQHNGQREAGQNHADRKEHGRIFVRRRRRIRGADNDTGQQRQQIENDHEEGPPETACVGVGRSGVNLCVCHRVNGCQWVLLVLFQRAGQNQEAHANGAAEGQAHDSEKGIAIIGQ